MLAGQARLAAGSMQACHEASSDGEGLVQQWRITQLTRLGIPGPLAQAEADRVGWHQIARLARLGDPVAQGGPAAGTTVRSDHQEPRSSRTGTGGPCRYR
jgi:hypothetical protein